MGMTYWRDEAEGGGDMASETGDVVIVGGGIVGLATAYYLGQAGVGSVVVERDAVGSHASGFAYGGLSPLGGEGIPGPLAGLAEASMALHRVLARELPPETGIDIQFRPRPGLSLAFTAQDAERIRAALPWQQSRPGYTARWLDAPEARRVEPRVAEEIRGAVLIEGGADVEPYRLVLALARAAERRGARLRHGRVTGLCRQGARVTGVRLDTGEITGQAVVLALGPWSGAAAAWLEIPVPVQPLKGQILRLDAPGPPVECSVGWGGQYASSKPDGLLWAGTTEEAAGFDEEPTAEGRDRIIASLVTMLPAMAEARLAQHTACLRPVAADGRPLLGPVPGRDGAYVATGGGRKGILLGPAMGRITADLIVQGRAALPIDAFEPARFSAAR
jgi:glycine oxidase